MSKAPAPVPFVRCYWAVPGKLLAGCYPGDPDPAMAQEKLAGLVRCGVGLVINLMYADEVNLAGQPFVDYCPALEDVARKAGRSIHCQRLSIHDMGVPTPAHMQKILDAIDSANAAGEVVYVHCWGGKGRTGTVVGCHLARHGIAVGDAALKRLSELAKVSAYDFGPVPQTTPQRDFVRTWVASVCGTTRQP